MRQEKSSSVTEAVLSRFSCRRFKKDKVPEPNLIKKIVELSCRAASGEICNRGRYTSSWHDARNELVEAIRQAQENGEMEAPQYPMYPDSLGGRLDDVYKQRRRSLGYAMYSKMGIERHEKIKGLKQCDATGAFLTPSLA